MGKYEIVMCMRKLGEGRAVGRLRRGKRIYVYQGRKSIGRKR